MWPISSQFFMMARQFLRTISCFDCSSGTYRNFGNNDQDDFRTVSGILRLSTKYMIDSLREKALAHLRIAWPSTLKGWEAREDLARSFEMATGSTGGHLYPSPVVSA